MRSNATLGVCKILAKCWEVLPPTIIADFLKKLVMELAADTTSPDVRCSVFKVETPFLSVLMYIVLENEDGNVEPLRVLLESHPGSKLRTCVTNWQY